MSEESIPIRPARVCGAGVNVSASEAGREQSRPSGTIPLQLTRRSTPPVGWEKRRPEERGIDRVIVDPPQAAVVPPRPTRRLDTFKVLLIALNVIEAVVLAVLLTRS